MGSTKGVVCSEGCGSMTTKIEGQLEIDHKRGVIYFHHGNMGYTVLRLYNLKIMQPVICYYCDNLATVVSISDEVYCDNCKHGHQIDHSLPMYQLDYRMT